MRQGDAFHVLSRDNMGQILAALESKSEAPQDEAVDDDEAILHRLQGALKKASPDFEIVFARGMELSRG